MYKRVVVIVLLVFAVMGLLYYANISAIKKQNEKVQSDQESKISSLQNEKQSLEKKLSDLQKQSKPQGRLLLTYADIQSSEIYNEGATKGAIYGSFDVVARVKNNSKDYIYNVKVASVFLKDMVGGTDLGTDAKAQTIKQLAPGEEKQIQFTGYQVDNPQISQEIMVSVFHPSISDINDASNVKKINIKSAFPPDTEGH